MRTHHRVQSDKISMPMERTERRNAASRVAIECDFRLQSTQPRRRMHRENCLVTAAFIDKLADRDLFEHLAFPKPPNVIGQAASLLLATLAGGVNFAIGIPRLVI
jgi:hypothetical protein